MSCSYVCDGYDPADCTDGEDEDARFCEKWNNDEDTSNFFDGGAGGEDAGGGEAGEAEATTEPATTTTAPTTTPTTTETWTTPEPNCTTFESEDGCPEERCEWEFDNPCAAALASDEEGCPTDEYECEWEVNCDGFDEEEGCPPEECFWEVNCDAHGDEDECPSEECFWEVDCEVHNEDECPREECIWLDEGQTTTFTSTMTTTPTTTTTPTSTTPTTPDWTGPPTPTTTPTTTETSTTPTTTSTPTTTETSTTPSTTVTSTLTTTPTTTTQTTTGTMTPALICLATSDCGEDEYEEMAPTEFLDRSCQPKTHCLYRKIPAVGSKSKKATLIVGAMEVVKPTKYSDRECVPITLCDTEVEYETKEPVLVASGYPRSVDQPLHAIADRECAPLRNCSVDEFQVAAATVATDRVCRSLSAKCAAGSEYESVRPTAISDRACRPISRECVVGEHMTLNYTETSDRVCTICERGSIDHDRDPLTACAFCPGGSFQDEEGRTSCRPSTNVCPIGTWQATAVNRSHERTCQYCDGITKYQDQAGQTQCKNVSTCPAGTRVSALHSVSSDTQCEACDGVGTYQDKEHQSLCMPVAPVCGFGFYELSGPSPDADRVCTPCDEGTFQDEKDQSACKPVKQCFAGTVEFKGPTVVTDRICIACDGVTGYQDQNFTAACKPVASCNPKTQFVQEDATPVSDVQCRALTICDDNKFATGFNNKTNDRMCSTHRDCEWPAEYEFQTPTSSTDRICAETRDCRQGHFEVEAPVFGGDDGVGSDRVCEKCTRCSSYGEWQAQACNTTVDAVCERCSECVAGETFEHRACGASEDRVCTVCSVCAGSVVNTALGAVYVGEFASGECSVDQDTTCTPCDHCKPWEYEKEQCTATSNTVCAPKCGFDTPDGTGGFEWNKREYGDADTCLPVKRCEFRDQFLEAQATPLTDRVCTNFTDCNSYELVEVTQATTPSPATTPGMSLAETERIMSAACGIRIIDSRTDSGFVERPNESCAINELCVWTAADSSADAGESVDAPPPTPTPPGADVCADETKKGPCNKVSGCQWKTKGRTSLCVSVLTTPPTPPPTPPAQAAPGTCTLNPEWLKTTTTPATTTRPAGPTEAPVVRLELVRLQYEIAAKTKVSDRMCKALTQCDDWQFEVTAPTDFADRHCLNLTVCEDGEWAMFKPTKKLDRVCELHTTCGEDEEVVVEGNQNRDFICAPLPVVVNSTGNATNATTLAATDSTANAGETAGTAILILLAIGALFGGVYYVRVIAGDSIANEKHRAAEPTPGAGVVEADLDTPFNGGDFWFNEESGVEVLPLSIYLRQPVLRPSKKVITISDDDSDDEVMGTYDIAGSQAGSEAGGIQLLSQSQYGQAPMSPMMGIQGQLQQHAAIMNNSYQSVLPGMDMTQMYGGGVPQMQMQSPIPAPMYQSPVPLAPVAVAAAAIPMPSLGIDMSALGALPTIDISEMSAVPAAAPVAAAPPVDDEEDTKL